MAHRTPSALLSLVGLMLMWPSVSTRSILPGNHTSETFPESEGHGKERPLVAKRSITSCGNDFKNYCLNKGECMLLLNLKEHHCKCERGFYGPRCSNVDFIYRPLDEGQILFIVFCVTLLMIGLAGALYFFFKWYKKNKFPRQQKRQGYKGVQTI